MRLRVGHGNRDLLVHVRACRNAFGSLCFLHGVKEVTTPIFEKLPDFVFLTQHLLSPRLADHLEWVVWGEVLDFFALSQSLQTPQLNAKPELVLWFSP